MSRPNDATEPFIAESEVSGADANERQQQRRQRRQIQQERRRAFRDRHFQDGKQQEFGFKHAVIAILKMAKSMNLAGFVSKKWEFHEPKLGTVKKKQPYC